MSGTPISGQLQSNTRHVQLGANDAVASLQNREGEPAVMHGDPGRRNAGESSFRRWRRTVFRSCLRSLPENRFGDRLFALIQFFRFHRRWPRDAMMYNDVLYRLKTSDEVLEPLRVFVSDKEYMKLYVKAVVGERYAVPTLGVIRRADDVDTFDFPAQCCIKATHTSGCVVLRKNGEPVDRARIKDWFRLNYYRLNREANYRSLKPKVIVEPLLFGSSNVQDYKVFCVDGQPKLIQVDVDRYIEHQRKYFDANWHEQDFSIKYPRTARTISKPANFDEMMEIAAKLSAAFWFVRIDLYSNDKEVYVGEITHCADNADGRFIPASAEQRVSALLFGSAPGR
jgi:hypothetical protein